MKRYEFVNDSTPARKKAIPAKVWERHQAEILSEFRYGDLAHVMAHMESVHNFIARSESMLPYDNFANECSEHQYKYRIYDCWKVKKNDLLRPLEQGDDTIMPSQNESIPDLDESQANAEVNLLCLVNADPPETGDCPERSSDRAQIGSTSSPGSEEHSQQEDSIIDWNSAIDECYGFPKGIFFVGPALSQTDSECPSTASSDHAKCTCTKRPANFSSRSSITPRKRLRSHRSSSSYSSQSDHGSGDAARPQMAVETPDRTGQHDSLRTFDQIQPPHALAISNTDSHRINIPNNDVDGVLQAQLEDNDTNETRGAQRDGHGLSDEQNSQISHFHSVFHVWQTGNVDTMDPTLHSISCDIWTLGWDDIRRLRDVADAFTASFTFEPAFFLHLKIWERLKGSGSSPLGDMAQVERRQLMACARAANTEVDLEIAQKMLESFLHERTHAWETGSHAVLNTFLVDICTRRSLTVTAENYREAAYIHLPSAETLVRTCQSEVTGPDLNIYRHLVRAHAFAFLKSKAPSPIPLLNSESALKKELLRVTKQIWSTLLAQQYDCIKHLVEWVRAQLSSPNFHELRDVRHSLNSRSTTYAKEKGTKVMALFIFLLSRLHRPSTSQRRDTAGPRASSLEKSFPADLIGMTGTSSADMLWIMSTVIINRMEGKVEFIVSPEELLHSALNAADSLARAARNVLFDQVLEAITSGVIQRRPIPGSLLDLHQAPGPFCPVKSSEGVIGCLWTTLGVFFHDRMVHTVITPGEETEVSWMDNNLVKGFAQQARPHESPYQVLITQRPSGRVLVPSERFSISSSIREFMNTSVRSNNLRTFSPRSSSSGRSLLPSRIMRRDFPGQTGSMLSFDTLSDAMSIVDISGRD